jgi:hypothetical protein
MGAVTAVHVLDYVALCSLHPGVVPDDDEALLRAVPTENEPVRHAILQCCVGEPTWLGRHGEWYDFLNWYAMELGQIGSDWSDAQLKKFLAGDPLLRLLLRLTKRGASIGWEDGGWGDGLLGWLSPDETRRFWTRLLDYPLASREPPPRLAELDPYLVHDRLGEMRNMLQKAVEVAVRASGEQRGILLSRR